MKKRLDEILSERCIVSSRSKAKDLVKRGLVHIDGITAKKPSSRISSRSRLSIAAGSGAQYVSRGALKLKAALDEFGFNPYGLDVLDVGASTGGFTEVLLERGASRVYAVDVGHGQLHERLRKEPRVISLEKQDARELNPSFFTEPLKAITIDVSFISLTKVLPSVFKLSSSKCWLIALIKPQFEVGRVSIGKDGVVKDESELKRTIELIQEHFAPLDGWVETKIISSPIRGGSGNREFLIGAHREA